jgi:ribosomal protein S18 acetylase RimI-like enzyme
MKNRENALTYTIRDRNEKEPVPYELLLQADPSRERIDSYVEKGRCRIACTLEEEIGIYVLVTRSFNDAKSEDTEDTEDTAEIVNISVAKKFQGQGFGKALVFDAIEIARAGNIRKLLVGTGNSSITQLGFYQRCGFRITGINLDFFTNNYPEKIIENGIVCRDLIQMTMEIE